MAAPRKKVVSKDDLRKFMKEKQSLTKAASKKVDHPLAKYNSLNQLVCVLCNNVIKNDLLWSAHILSKGHKERALALKTQGPAKPDHISSSPTKRKALPSSSLQSDEKRRKTETKSNSKSSLPSDFFDNDVKPSKDEIRERAKAAFLAGYSSSDESDEDEEEETQPRGKTKVLPDSSTASSSTPSGLPADFFDPGHEPSSSDDTKTEASHSKKMSEILPEGFFDDPKMDAKIRKVEYKDKEEEEWELFQKMVKEEAHVSEVIMEEENEQVNMDRNIDEIDDQMQRWQEVENLHVKKETILESSKDGQKKEESGDEVDEEELDEFMDWRAKKSLK